MLHLLRPRSAAVGHVLQMSFARGGVFADWVVRESVGSTRPSSVLSGSCRFVPSCLTMWPHMGLIGRVFLNRWCRLQKDAARWDRALPNRTRNASAIRGATHRRPSVVLWERMPLSFTTEQAVAEQAVERVRSGGGVLQSMP